MYGQIIKLLQGYTYQHQTSNVLIQTMTYDSIAGYDALVISKTKFNGKQLKVFNNWHHNWFLN